MAENPRGPRIYTRTGDLGETYCSLVGGRVGKDHPCVEFLGALDEAEAAVGFAWSLAQGYSELGELAAKLRWVEDVLFRIGFYLAGSTSCVDEELVEQVERLIDKFSLMVTPGFKLNGGHPVAAAVSVARTAVRRAERSLWRCAKTLSNPQRVALAAKLLNRLSDLLYTLQHLANQLTGVDPGRPSCARGRY